MSNKNIYKSKGYLVEGISGKQMQKAKYATNNAVKAENTSISFCIKQVLKHNDNYLQGFKEYKKGDINPANLLPLLTEKEARSGKFTAYLVLNLIGRFYKSTTNAVEVKVAA
jgi:hypothetical protein